ncbi:MAG: DNA-binding protein [Clostridia bacterium]|jgi:uncharacterized protein|nr:DNA-binding protein [Clostridia bacterium]MBT7121675.1 DNA-binding protein [Clostridia bacterium]
MEYRRFGDKIVARIDRGEEIMSEIKTIAQKESIATASVNALGALSEVTIGYINVYEKQYHSKDYSGIYEMAGLHGTISSMDGEVYLHIHCTVSDEQNNALGGHMTRAVVSATCEMVIDVIDGVVGRKFNDDVGLNLFDF